MAEPDGSQQAPGQSRRRDYAPGSKIAVMIRLLEKHEAPLEPRRGRRPIVIAVVLVVLVVAMLGFLVS